MACCESLNVDNKHQRCSNAPGKPGARGNRHSLFDCVLYFQTNKIQQTNKFPREEGQHGAQYNNIEITIFASRKCELHWNCYEMLFLKR